MPSSDVHSVYSVQLEQTLFMVCATAVIGQAQDLQGQVEAQPQRLVTSGSTEAMKNRLLDQHSRFEK